MKKRALTVTLAAGMMATSIFGLSACDQMKGMLDKMQDQYHDHVVQLVEAVDPTCETDGNKAYYKCDCGKFFLYENPAMQIEENSWVLPAGHTWDEGEVLAEPTYKTGGMIKYTCTVCETEKQELLSALDPAALFAGGLGTEESPYLIETAEHLTNVRELYDTYSYYKVADGVETIDCTGWAKNVNFNGNFDGNGVELLNLTAALFNTVGYQNTDQDITLENFTVTMNASTALVHNLFNGGETTFKNIVMHGYIEGKYNLGCFYRYGTANYDDVGCDYTINFVNCQSDVTMVETSGNVPGALVGHAYQGAGNTVTINVDTQTAYTGKQYGTAKKGHYYMSMDSGNTVLNVNGEKIEDFHWGGALNVYDSYQQLAIVNPTKASDNSFVVEKQTGVVSMSVSVNAQISAYDANGEKIPNEAGITIVLDTKTLTELSDTTKLLHSFDSIQLVTDADEYGFENVNGVLMVYVMKSGNCTYDGNVTLQVVQYDANGKVLSVGSLLIGQIVR